MSKGRWILLLLCFSEIGGQSFVTRLSGGGFDASFFVDLIVGGQNFTLTVDTGSSATGIVGQHCQTSTDSCKIGNTKPCVSRHPPYQQGTSAEDITCSDPPGSASCDPCLAGNDCGMNMSYLDGSCMLGEVVRDSIQIAGLSSQFYFLAFDLEKGMTDPASDGIMGLAFSDLADEFPTLTDQLASQGDLKSNEFGLCLGTEPVMVLGDMDETFYEGDISWLPIVEKAWYCVELTDMLYDDASLSVNLTGDCPTIIDSGTTLLLIPTASFNKLLDSLRQKCASIGNPAWLCGREGVLEGHSLIVPAAGLSDVLAQLPTFQVVLEGHQKSLGVCDSVTFTLTAAHYMRTAVSDNSSILIELGVVPGPDGSVILGDVFMAAFYVHFDKTNEQVAIALGTCGTPLFTDPSLQATITHAYPTGIQCVSALEIGLIVLAGICLLLVLGLGIPFVICAVRRRAKKKKRSRAKKTNPNSELESLKAKEDEEAVWKD